ncbi:hypothetical protein evm_001733 [Chilo suppressalis]|nr:hypothetical protein evm_001733 [Chilo suppressalis]
MGATFIAIARPLLRRPWKTSGFRCSQSVHYRLPNLLDFCSSIGLRVVGLLCDLLILKNSKTRVINYQIPEGFQGTFFASIIWPSTFVVFSLFWSVYSYDRQLVYPDFLDKVLSPISNHIMHTAILPLSLWEILFQPRTTPRSHWRYLGHMTFHFLLYLGTLIYTYVESGIWLYPILKEVYGTPLLPVLILGAYALALIGYYIQWVLPSFAKVSEKSKRKNR